ncbi:hypothetical protein V8E36_008073 [Tilletia maclaganii]
MEDTQLKQQALARAAAARASLQAELEAATKADLARRRAADLEQKREAERKRALVAAQQKRAADEARIKQELEEKRKRSAEAAKKAEEAAHAALLLGPAKRGSGSTLGSGARNRTQSASTPQGTSKMMATFNSVVAKTARKKSASDFSLLTREEKRERKLAASLGVDKRAVARASSSGSLRSSASKSPSRSLMHNSTRQLNGAAQASGTSTGSRSTSAGGHHASSSTKAPLPTFTRKAAVIGPDKTFDEAITLGQEKRDKRSIDEIERDLRAAKEAKLREQGGLSNSQLEERKRREEEHRRQEEKRRAAMAEKRRADLQANGIAVPPEDASPPRNRKPEPPLPPPPRSRQESPAVNARLLAAAEFHNRKAVAPPPPPKIRVNGKDAKLKRGRSGRASEGDVRDPSPLGRGGSPAVATPTRKETPRERFIREEAEKKKRAKAGDLSGVASVSGKGKAVADRGRRRHDEEEDDDAERSYGDESEADSFVVDDAEELSGMDEDESDEDDNDGDRRYRKKHKTSHAGKRSSSGRSSGSRKGGSSSMREEIWRIMGRDRSKYVDMEDSDDDDIMEATAADIAREEVRSGKIAKEEDTREQAAEEAHAREKAARLKQLAKKARATTR